MEGRIVCKGKKKKAPSEEKPPPSDKKQKGTSEGSQAIETPKQPPPGGNWSLECQFKAEKKIPRVEATDEMIQILSLAVVFVWSRECILLGYKPSRPRSQQVQSAERSLAVNLVQLGTGPNSRCWIGIPPLIRRPPGISLRLGRYTGSTDVSMTFTREASAFTEYEPSQPTDLRRSSELNQQNRAAQIVSARSLLSSCSVRPA
ncbi:hypothetical protein BJX76DRAFT_17543 [Aspergillus varians]